MARFERLGRRSFISQMGKGVLGIAVLGAAGACGDDSTAATSGPTSRLPTTAAPATAGVPATTAAPAPTTTGATATTEPPATRGVSVERVILGSVSAYLLVRGSEAAIVDTGGRGSHDTIEASLRAIGLDWSNVGSVVLTHLHNDHIGSVGPVMQSATDADGYAGEADIPRIAAPRPLTAVATGDTVFGLDIISTPGHTPGHVSVFDPSGRTLIVGDALNGAGSGMAGAEASGVAGPNPAYTPDMATANGSAQVLATLAPVAVFFGHGEPLLESAAAALAALTE